MTNTPANELAALVFEAAARITDNTGAWVVPNPTIKHMAIAAIAAELAPTLDELAEIKREAVRLAEVMWSRSYKDTAPDWKPLNSAAVISQINNMHAGVLSRIDELAGHKADAQNMRRQLNEAGDNLHVAHQTNAMLVRRIEAAEADLRLARIAIEKYGRHLGDESGGKCNAKTGCSCGLSAVIAALKEDKP